eukprot:858512_1
MSLFQKLGKLKDAFARGPNSIELTQLLLQEVQLGNLQSVIRFVTSQETSKKLSYRYRNEDGDCALHIAVKHKHNDIAKILLELAPETAMRKNKRTGMSPLFMAVQAGSSDLIRTLANYRANLEEVYNGSTALMYASELGDLDSVQTLLKHGASKFSVDRYGKTAFHYAKDQKLKDILDPSTSRSSEEHSQIRTFPVNRNSDLPVHTQYKVGRRIGEGAYAASYIAKNLKYNFDCVLKILAANNIDDVNDCLVEGLTLALFKNCDHVIRFKDFYIDIPPEYVDLEFSEVVKRITQSKRIKPGSKRGNCSVNLAMEWAKGGDVFTLVSNRLMEAADEEDKLEREMYERSQIDPRFSYQPVEIDPKPFSEDEILKIVRQICEALVEVHKAHFIHRDIKPGNLFLDKDGNIRIGDFGIAKFYEDSYKENAPAHTVVGSQNYMASEMHDTSKPYTHSVDLFAIGCVIYFMVRFNHPNFFMKDSLAQVLPEMAGKCSDFIYKLVARMWDPDPKLRPSAANVLEYIETRFVPPSSDVNRDPTTIRSSPDIIDKEKEKKQKRQPLRRRYAVGRRIGQTNLFKARHLFTRKKYVMKRMVCSSIAEVNARLQEAAYLAHLRRSENIVSFQDLFIDFTLRRELEESADDHDNTTTEDCLSVCIVMQFCPGGDLATLIMKHAAMAQNGDAKAHFPEEKVVQWMLNISTGLGDIHRANVIHRNICPENIFLTENYDAIIGEFGSAKDLEVFGDARTIVGTPEYTAPEILQRPKFGDRGSSTYDSAVDVFGLGVVIHEILTLRPPRYGNLAEIPDIYSEFLHRITAEMMNADPRRRPTADQLVEHLRAYQANPNVVESPLPRYDQPAGGVPRRIHSPTVVSSPAPVGSGHSSVSARFIRGHPLAGGGHPSGKSPVDRSQSPVGGGHPSGSSPAVRSHSPVGFVSPRSSVRSHSPVGFVSPRSSVRSHSPVGHVAPRGGSTPAVRNQSPVGHMAPRGGSGVRLLRTKSGPESPQIESTSRSTDSKFASLPLSRRHYINGRYIDGRHSDPGQAARKSPRNEQHQASRPSSVQYHPRAHSPSAHFDIPPPPGGRGRAGAPLFVRGQPQPPSGRHSYSATPDIHLPSSISAPDLQSDDLQAGSGQFQAADQSTHLKSRSARFGGVRPPPPKSELSFPSQPQPQVAGAACQFCDCSLVIMPHRGCPLCRHTHMP